MNDTWAGERVRRLRLAAGIGQVDFATALNASNGFVSMMENGLVDIPSDLVGEIGSILGCRPEFLYRNQELPVLTSPLLRAYADAPKRAVDRQVADASIAVEFVEAVQLRRMRDKFPVWAGDLDDESDIEDYAHDVRVAAQIGEGAVVGNVIRAAERLGCLVLPMPDELGRHLGISLRIGLTPTICVGRSSGALDGRMPGDRQRFTVAHELGHLGMHGHVDVPRSASDAASMERQAHYFAGAFLIPGDTLMDDLREFGGRATLQTLTEVKARRGVSVKALVARLKNLHVIDEDHARSLYKQISSRGWNRREPVEVGAEAAIWMSRAIDRNFPGGEGLDRSAEAAGLRSSHVRRWTDWTFVGDGAPSATVTPIRSR